MQSVNGSKKLQSAMEYLMTYGWAILIIAVVLGALYQLGIFNSSSLGLSSSCFASSGFLCQMPTLNSSGYLAIKFGQIGKDQMTITNLACTTNVTTPTTTNSVNLQLTSGATAVLAFSCPLASNAIGSPFKGYLWLTYSTSTQSGIVDRIATVTAKVATTGNVIAILGGGTSAGGYVAPFIATCGGTLTLVSGNDICTFTSNGLFTVTSGSGNVAVLVVGGGGGGGGSGGSGSGGGGGGGFQSQSSFAVITQAYSVVVGAGGAGGPGPNGVTSGIAGQSSVFSTITAGGGGGGGSGPGGGGNSGTPQSSSGGGTGGAFGGGGGGAGGVGTIGSGNPAGSGGVGMTSSISGASVYYSGGGGGSYAGTGGNGGGASAPAGTQLGNSGTANLGGGGSGANSNSGGNGGSGVVIIAWNALGNGTP